MRSLTLVLLASCAALIACGSEPPPPPQTAAAVTAAPPPQPPPAPPAASQVDDNPNKSNINISDEIKRACGITDAEAFFAFDSANVRDQDRVVLRKLAVCFSTGPLKGREMRLVGHADPRGDEEYNRVLGQRRADNVKQIIASLGMVANKIATTSRGEDEARGTNEASWAEDRRVDVVLGA
ncbi:MAG TPA: OmpA family protein [Polyangiaceae bacterium]|nr:OmpA family protein [Polyangiaceae bacterium]